MFHFIRVAESAWLRVSHTNLSAALHASVTTERPNIQSRAMRGVTFPTCGQSTWRGAGGGHSGEDWSKNDKWLLCRSTISPQQIPYAKIAVQYRAACCRPAAQHVTDLLLHSVFRQQQLWQITSNTTQRIYCTEISAAQHWNYAASLAYRRLTLKYQLHITHIAIHYTYKLSIQVDPPMQYTFMELGDLLLIMV